MPLSPIMRTFVHMKPCPPTGQVEPPCYLVDFSTWEPPEEWKVDHKQLMQMMAAQQCFNEQSMAFLEKILAQSGTGQATAWPPSIVQCLKDGKPQDTSVENARSESKQVICDVIRDVLEKTGTKPKEVDILIINCSLFSPTPSLCALAAHEFGMRSDLCSYNLSGMGCSASVIAIDLAKQLLRSRPNALALVASRYYPCFISIFSSWNVLRLSGCFLSCRSLIGQLYAHAQIRRTQMRAHTQWVHAMHGQPCFCSRHRWCQRRI